MTPGEGARDERRAVEKLQALVRIPTVSHRDASLVDTAAFDRLLAELERQFPLLHERLELTRIPTHALLFRWPGRSAERPVVLMAHLDVVPVEGTWQHPPFSGDVVDGSIWGRGTLDDKGCVAGICEAVETLLEDGFVPAQDVWLSFGCDEEVSGDAAPLAVEELVRRGVRPWFVLDEGGAVASEAFPGVAAPVGVVGVTEKGVTSLELRVEGRGGHASTPARMGPTARIARAITRIDRSPMPASTPEPTIELFRRLAPHAPLPLRALMANAGRLGPVLSRALVAAGPEPAAMTRTTFAVTTLSGSPALNVVAATAKAGVNIRIMVGDTVAGVLEHVRKVVADDEVHIDVVEQNEPSPISPRDEAFGLVETTIAELFPDAVPAPYVMMAATDSRFFTRICDRVYRFAPFRMTKAQRESIHSYDEHLGVEAFLDGVRWYRRLIERLPA
ncbi:M20/M25/M40 family metallo-hydrolase [Nocardioides marmotae]|uniref:M20/M25/M40 family metallo-hydrolase n=1 Tax=Nocardioides marmotae TaxID=2663857 RepID=A0A6I3JF97_9ACTN|nr:M20/M25/M40 family metallo-hydrolase [Nocardioides marmotae]MCR6033167.1 M20/M25/M40 family metallo-hydrolase [Gordonia jinghuaiqii]MBC9732671.1 M20/M25/M40 family metallo-hydrolase [Nocardioides marmotae]MTB83788.1 M20/M25/M40 family metallo-hydrolase [Nocardioides marmotae]MTB96820.1 M20/M25/M40 family metallo-hydrolase [Nocardioides marmotae]QKE02977.1 M20/M25/M40 family metallo-hydrolase [Nocardioides marmotae]